MRIRLYLCLMYTGAGLVGIINMLIIGGFITRQSIYDIALDFIKFLS